jgi:AcrR family transcriptional regulator
MEITPPVKRRASPRRKARGAFHHGDLRAQLVLAAAEVVARRGHEALTLGHVARRVGVTEPAVYRHFANKAALLAAVSVEGLAELQRALVVAAASTADPAGAVTAIGRTYVRHALAHAGWFRLHFGGARPAPPAADAPPGEDDALALVDAVARLAPAGTDVMDVLRALWAQWHGLAVFVVERVFERVPDDAGRLAAADAAIDVFVDALVARRGGAETGGR